MLIVKPSPLQAVANVDRLNDCFQKQKDIGKPVYYILPSNKYLQAARKRKAGIAFKTFDDLADLILKKANINYFPASESERTLFFQELMSNEQNRFLQNAEELRHKAKAYAETYGQLKRMGLKVDELPAHFQQMEAVFKEYELNWVKIRRLLDPENRIHEAVSLTNLEDIELGGIVIDGYLDFSTLQYMVISYFVSLGFDITIYLPQIKGVMIVTETENELKKLGFTIMSDAVTVEPDTEKPHIELKSATTIDEEINGVLEEIVINNHQVPFSEVGILIVDERSYLEKLKKTANDKNIPLKLPQKKRLKDTLFFQFIYQSLLKHNGRFLNRWDRIDLIDTLLRLQFLESVDYMNFKKAYIETGALPDECTEKVEEMITYRKSVPKKASLVDYLKSLQELLETNYFTAIWKERFAVETNTEKLQQIRLEWKAYEQFNSFMTTKITMLENQGLDDLNVHYHIFVEWLYEGLESSSLYIEREPVNGIALHSFRDVALFQGASLYVLGMNEGKFPKGHKLSGYFQESDLNNLPIPFASPSRRLFREKDDAFFMQLFSVASHLSFSYVVGVDPHNPLLPSVYLEQWKPIIEMRKYSATERFASKTSASLQEYEEKIAYHHGIGKDVQHFPDHLKRIAKVIKKLEKGEEFVSTTWEEKLRKDRFPVTMLESYAACPFKYALERVLNVKEPTEKQTNLDFRDVGSMLHTIIEKFYKQQNLVGKPFATFTEELKETAESILIDIFEEEWAKVEANHLDFSKLQLSIEKEEWLKKLKKWWFAERKHFWENRKLKEMHLFRLEEKVELDIKIDEDTTVTLSGKIDRIDIDEHGFVIYDYKSGFASLNFQKEVRPGLKLQLPLYLVAMQNRLENGHYEIDLSNLFAEMPTDITAHGASYISLREPAKRAGNSVWREEHFGSKNAFGIHSSATKEETLEAEALLAKYELKKRLKDLWEGSSNDFSVKPLKCMNNCVYKSVCRVTQEQIEQGEGEWK
ncbi:hypothetical protein BKP35_14210 [Anaerobacillus arseniciselenatis]|uniref:PD-(D/E)XK endonuclease-like domain-containing protein n=1 Tax=Anaerobacillus arseniciselenatis TaxID=85682 RepID=A0A1S2LCM0_9BACI|nr:PD-(D/E)XK nuclease family protein [Anaerobacillus arseniciselenatis]OIJ10249.1 hypothetical protein BKP35_14210 [Anaerobacillus arseniciselenatis]